MLHPTAQAVDDVFPAAGDAQVVVLVVCVLEEVVPEILVVEPWFVDVVRIDHPGVEDVLEFGLVESLFDPGRDSGRSGCAPFGEDLDHTGGGIGAVQRARGATLGDFNPLDVGRYQVGKR